MAWGWCIIKSRMSWNSAGAIAGKLGFHKYFHCFWITIRFSCHSFSRNVDFPRIFNVFHDFKSMTIFKCQWSWQCKLFSCDIWKSPSGGSARQVSFWREGMRLIYNKIQDQLEFGWIQFAEAWFSQGFPMFLSNRKIFSESGDPVPWHLWGAVQMYCFTNVFQWFATGVQWFRCSHGTSGANDKIAKRCFTNSFPFF